MIRMIFVGLVAWAVCTATGQVEASDPMGFRRAALEWAAQFGGDRAVTRPSRDAVIGFTLPTAVREVAVVGGQRVKQGDLLVRGDDAEDRAEAEFNRMRAQTPLPLDRAVAEETLAKIEYDRAQEADQQGAGAPAELDRYRVRFETAAIDRQLAVLNQTLAQLQADKAEARAEKLTLRAPFDGVVDIVLVDTGQSVGAGDPVVRVVRVDPLWIDVPVPTERTIELGTATGDTAWVLMPRGGKPEVFLGKVIEVAPTADSQSGTRRVRVEVPNASAIVPGLNCWVRFTEPEGEWKDRIVRAPTEVPDAASERSLTNAAEGSR